MLPFARFVTRFHGYRPPKYRNMTDRSWRERLGRGSALYHQMKSPLRLQLLSLIVEAPTRAWGVDELSRRSGHTKQDVVGCLTPMVDAGVLEAARASGGGWRLKPDDDELLAALSPVLEEHRDLIERFRRVRERYFGGMIGTDEKMKFIFEMMRTIARSDVTVLIRGETGTGKELVARAVHDLSVRGEGPFQDLSCATIQETLFESEMFGHERGAFTGAVGRKIGKMEAAHKGTLFLDEIGELSTANQVKLLRVLQTQTFSRVGGGEPIHSDFRLISATNRHLEDMVEQGQFREDLYYRINVFPIQLPSLRERPEDIPILAREFLSRFCERELGAPDAVTFADDALEALLAYDWPGNVRQLENAVTRMAITAPTHVLTGAQVLAAGLVPRRRNGEAPPATADIGAAVRPLRDVERAYIESVMQRMKGNMKRTAELLGISRVTLYNKVREYGIPRGGSED